MWRAEVSGESRMRTKHLEGSETEVSEGEVRRSVSGRGREIPLCGGSSHFLFVCQLYFPPSCCTQEVGMTTQL